MNQIKLFGILFLFLVFKFQNSNAAKPRTLELDIVYIGNSITEEV